MTELELYRNFVAIVRAGSVSGAGRARSLTQPAVSQQLAALEEIVGLRLFRRTRKGMLPTARGKALYSQLSEPIDWLERVTRSLRGQRILSGTAPVRIGASPDYFHAVVLKRLKDANLQFIVTFGEGKDLLLQLEAGVFDAVISTQMPASRTLQHWITGEHQFVLAGSVDLRRPKKIKTLSDLGVWLATLPWVSYSLDLPITRRFWQQSLGRRFDAKLAFVIPDLRTVVRSVELGFGVSILPDYLFENAHEERRVHELWRIRSLIPSERCCVAVRDADSDRPDIRRLIERLAAQNLRPAIEPVNQ